MFFFFFYQHPDSLSLVEFALQPRGNEVPQLGQKTLHHQVGQDLWDEKQQEVTESLLRDSGLAYNHSGEHHSSSLSTHLQSSLIGTTHSVLVLWAQMVFVVLEQV